MDDVESQSVGESARATKVRRHGKVSKGAKKFDASPVDQVISYAERLGVPIDDGRSEDSGGLCIKILETPDARSRKLVRMLLRLDFKFAPGEGYRQ